MTASASTAPWATSCSALAAVRFHTVVGCPLRRNAAASARPINPRPITVTGLCPAVEPSRGSSGYREHSDDDVVTVVQIRKLLQAGLSTQDIVYLLPCATGTAPDLESCPEMLDMLRARLHGMDEHIDTLVHSRRTLHDYLRQAEKV
jgi:DNA-binding transcriptional MerR regulator